MAESALMIAVPEAEPLVKALRDKFDPSAATGVPAHITILYPFIPPHEITAAVLTGLRELFARFPVFEFTLRELRRFPKVLYLAPVPAESFKGLTSAVVGRYPGYPPYGDTFPEVIPHLTIADVDTPDRLDAIEGDFLQRHGAELPVTALAYEILLIEDSSGRWIVRQAFELSRR